MLLVSGQLIIERLRQLSLPVGGSVFSADDLAGVAEKSQVVPAIHVLLHSYLPVERLGGELVWDETYLVVTVVKHAARKDRPAAQQQEAVPIVNAILGGLSGWRFPVGAGVSGLLEVVPGPRPRFTDSHAYFPIAVRSRPCTVGGEDS